MIKFLPSDITSLQQKLSHLLGEFQDSNTPATRNEIVAIADNLLRRKHILPVEYRRINDYMSMHHCNQCPKTFTRKSNLRRHQENSCNGDGLYLFKRGHGLEKVAEKVADTKAVEKVADTKVAEKVADTKVAEKAADTKVAEKVDDHDMTDDEMEPVSDPKEVLANKIKDTVEYLIRHDKAEIKELLTKFQDYDEFYENDVIRLSQLVETWIEEQVATENKIPFDDIEHVLWKLQSSSIPRSKLIRLEILLKDIFLNRYRVTDIVKRMDPILSHLDVLDKDVSDALKRLVRDGLISEEQHDALSKEDDLNLDKVISEIKTTKIGRGISFLPRETPDLLTKLKEWVMDFATHGTASLRQKILGVLDELLFRKVITKQEHKDITP